MSNLNFPYIACEIGISILQAQTICHLLKLFLHNSDFPSSQMGITHPFCFLVSLDARTHTDTHALMQEVTQTLILEI